MKTMGKVLLWLVLSLAVFARVEAQPYGWQNCATCYWNYTYMHGAGADSLFLYGVIGAPANLGGLAHDSLRIRELVEYGAPTIIPSTDTSESVRLMRAILDSARVRGMKVRYPAITTANLAKFACWTFESYVGTAASADSLQAFDCQYSSTQGSPDTTILARDHVFGWRDDSSNGGDHLMVAKPRFTSNALISGDDIALSTDMYTKRYPIYTPNVDSTMYVRMTIAMTADYPRLGNDSISDNAVIAFGVIYRRDTNNQATCKCANYVVVDTLKITKAMLLSDSIENAGDGFSNFHSRYYHIPTEFPAVGRFGNADTSPACRDSCDSLRARTTAQDIDERNSDNNIVEGSDRLVFRFYTTRRVPVRYLRTSINQYSYQLLQRGRFDTLIRREVDGVYNTPLLDTNYAGFALVDEPWLINYRAYGIISSKIQDFRFARAPLDKRKIVSIGYASYGSRRAFSGDLDSMRYKLMQGITTDRYFTEGYFPIPIKYGNPDSTRGIGRTKAFRADADSTGSGIFFPQMVFYNDSTGYHRYLASLQTVHRNADTTFEGPQIGSFRDSRTSISSNVGPFLSNLARAVDISRYRNLRWGPGSPVYGIVTTHGRFNIDAYTGTFHIRPPTPEEITVQCWLALNCNVDGIVFSHFNWNGRELGIAAGDTTSNQSDEYALLKNPGNPSNTAQWIDTLWVGFASRFAAVQRFTSEMKRFDSVYQRLDYRREEMSVHDLGQSFNEIPMVDSIRTERAYRDTIAFKGTNTFDPRDSTYLEISHFRPGSRDSNGIRTYARYLLITNRRCWPIDHGTYSSTAAHGGSTHGFGNIDVRRPWIKLKNSTGVMADSFIVEKVGRESEWHRTIAVGQLDSLCALDWLEPGWGQLYRLRPVPAGVGFSGTAYNNAVHSENPSTDVTERDRLTVYMRDSIVYLRATDSTGTWSREWMISDAADSVSTSGSRVANNMHPALATVRNDSALVVVWERKKVVGDTATVEMAHFNGLPRRTNFPTPTRLRLSSPRRLVGAWMIMTPSIIGVDSGWVVSWATPLTGIEVRAIRNVATPTTTAFSPIVKVKAQTINAYGNPAYAIDSVSLFPTLAYVRNYNTLLNAGQMCHMAWQQGNANSSNEQFILYRTLSVRFTTGAPPVLSAGLFNEHVSSGLPGCQFLHPSIAADSVWVGVAFQQNFVSERRVVLRFKDTTARWSFRAWNTPSYIWGGRLDTSLPNRYFERPSVTEFPLAVRPRTIPAPFDGALTWQWTNSSDGVRNRQLLYRYGWSGTREIPSGEHPSMTLVPYKAARPYDASSVFYRGDTASRFRRWRTMGGPVDSITYYPGIARLTTEPVLTNDGLMSKKIRAELTFTKTLSATVCRSVRIITGIRLTGIANDEENNVVLDPATPGVPPSFFGSPLSLDMMIDSLPDGVKIARTSVFTPGGLFVQIQRYSVGYDSVTEWLDSEPYDSSLGMAADIKTYLELVRASDSTVLWRGDTLSARAIGDSTVDHIVSVPLTGVSPGTAVYIRLKGMTTAGLAHDFGAGFVFEEDEESSGGVEKRSLPRQGDNGKDESVEKGVLNLSFVPNPIRGQGVGTLQVEINTPGEVDLALYDVTGAKVEDLPVLEADQPGRYDLHFSSGGLAEGVYMIVAEIGGYRRSIQVQVMK
jgi:hypothetical protein